MELQGITKKQQTEIAYSYLIQFILVKVLVDNNYSNFENQYKQRLKVIVKNLKNGGYLEILSQIGSLSEFISKDLYKPFSEDQKFINDRFNEIKSKIHKELTDITPWLDIMCYINKYNFAGIRNDIFGFIYENYLKALYEEKNLGQYFTPPEVVNFMLEEIGYTEEEIKKRVKENNGSLSIIDPSCGSGTFLYSATNLIMESISHEAKEEAKKVEELVQNNVFGLDVEPFSLYLAEMGILMRLLPCIINEKYNNKMEKKLKIFKTSDSVAEFIDSNPANTKAGKNCFDFVIGNPPYIGYNECSKMRLKFIEICRDKTTALSMSNIYGVNMNTVKGRTKAYSPKPNLYAFFMALGLGLLKEGGKMCYIIPQTLLTSNDLDVMRYHLAENTSLEKIIIFSSKMFIKRGIKNLRDIATSSLIFIVRKQAPKEGHKVEIINYTKAEAGIDECLEDIRRNKNINKKLILQTELLNTIENWNFLKQDDSFLKFYDYYKTLPNLDNYRLESDHSKVIYFDKGLVFKKDDIKKDTSGKSFFYLTKTIKNKFTLEIIDEIIEEEKLIFPKGAQGIKVYNAKYKIVWSYMNSKGFYFSDNNIMVNFNWVLIASNSKEQIIYLYSILINPISSRILESLFASEGEKSFNIGIKSIKSFIRIPTITEENKAIKEEVIKKTEEMLSLEEVKLKNLVDFKYSGVLPLTFKTVEVKEGSLIVDGISFKIKKSESFVKTLIEKECNNLSQENHSLSKLKELEAIDFEKRNLLKNYIDHLIFALYFSINLKSVGEEYLEQITNLCAQNEFYELTML